MLITDIWTHAPKKRPTLHQITDHDFFTRSIFPPSIPNILISDKATKQSQLLRCLAHRSHTGDTDIRTIDIVDSGPQLDAATAQQQQKQEREFHKAVQPGSPISVLLRSAREPLLVLKSPLHMSHRASENRLPTNALLRKLSAVAPTSSVCCVYRKASTAVGYWHWDWNAPTT